MTLIELLPDSLVLLVGASGSGKSTWAYRHFVDTQVVSSDRCRALVSDREEDQTANREAFAVFYTLLRQRLALGRLTVADSTGLQAFSRERMRSIAAERGRLVHAVVFRAPVSALLAQNQQRARRVPEAVILRQAEALAELVSTGVLEAEGYASVHYLTDRAAALMPPRLLPHRPSDPLAGAREDGANP